MFRYYSWLPVELEPEYTDGFTCDKCGEDFLAGPFYHHNKDGQDYCVPCGESKGLTPHRGLVSSLLFSDTGEVLRDSETGSIVVFGYQTHKDRFGLHFSDGANIGIHFSPVRSILSMDYWPRPAPSHERESVRRSLDPREWQDRFPWLSGPLFRQTFPMAILIHEAGLSDSLPVSEDLVVSQYDHAESGFSLRLGDGWEQVFDSESGVEVVAKDSHVVSLFQPQRATAHVWEKVEAQQLFDEMTTILNDKT